jgi:hypothetical protein
MIEITGGIAEDIDLKLRGVLGPVADLMQAEADRILADARRVWPVKTGKSRDSWETSLRVLPGTFSVEVGLFSRLQYVRYIRSSKYGRGEGPRYRSPLVTHIRQPVREAKKVLRKKLVPALAEYLEQKVFSNGR